MDPFYETMLIMIPMLIVGGIGGVWLMPKLDRLADWVEWRWEEWRERRSDGS